MTDIDMRPFACRPRRVWTRIHKWGGIALLCLFCAGVGNAAATAEFKVPFLWARSATLQHVESHDIPKLKALIPKDTGSAKTDGVITMTSPKRCQQ